MMPHSVVWFRDPRNLFINNCNRLALMSSGGRPLPYKFRLTFARRQGSMGMPAETKPKAGKDIEFYRLGGATIVLCVAIILDRIRLKLRAPTLQTAGDGQRWRHVVASLGSGSAHVLSARCNLSGLLLQMTVWNRILL